MPFGVPNNGLLHLPGESGNLSHDRSDCLHGSFAVFLGCFGDLLDEFLGGFPSRSGTFVDVPGDLLGCFFDPLLPSSPPAPGEC